MVPALTTSGIDSFRLKCETVIFYVSQYKNWVQSFTRVTMIKQDLVVVNYSFNLAYLVLQQIIWQHSAGSRVEVFMGDCLTEMEWEMQSRSSWMTQRGNGSFLLTVGVRRALRTKKKLMELISPFEPLTQNSTALISSNDPENNTIQNYDVTKI